MKVKNSKKNKKVLIALSGGIDSAVSAYLLLKQGYDVEAAFMKNWSSTKGLKYDECPWLVDRQDALRVAAFLKIPLHTIDFEKQYEKNVLNYFFNEYKAGRTPNPDVMCNKEIKFKLLYDWAMKRGFDYLATGHYARIVKSRKSKVESRRLKGDAHQKATLDFSLYDFRLARSADEFKDQTYFIYNIKTEQLPHVLFPIGDKKKSEVKALAKKIGLPNAGKKESMGLCFVGRIRLKDFLDQKLHELPGDIINQSGKVIGKHQGLHYYTIGQRQGIKIGGSGPYYVVKKDLFKNVLLVTNDENDPQLETKSILVHSVNWIKKPLKFPLELIGRFRHQGELVILKIKQASGDQFEIRFKKPQKSIASGQSLVLYDMAKVCVGGGVIV